jgi:hypothetical protein
MGAAVDAANPQAVWQKLLSDIQNKPAYGWIRSLRLDRFENSTAYLSLLPGQREMARFFGDRQRTQLAQMIGQLMGRPVKVELVIPAGLATDSSDDAGSSSPGAGNSRAAITAAQRQEVMSLPLVRDLMEVFDLSLVEVRRQQPAQEQAADEPAEDQEREITEPSADDLLLDELMEDQE